MGWKGRPRLDIDFTAEAGEVGVDDKFERRSVW